MTKLLTVQNDAKTVKSEGLGYLTGIQYFSPAKLSGYEMCAYRSLGCTLGCLNTAGRAAIFPAIADARMWRTKLFMEQRTVYIAQLKAEILSLIKRANRLGLKPCVRLNGTSDLGWEKIRLFPVTDAEGCSKNVSVMERFPEVQFYDYTKSVSRMLAYMRGEMPANYHLTFSRSETNDALCAMILARGGNVAVVYGVKRHRPLSATWLGYKVVDGDQADARFLDVKGVVVGLRAKGKAKKDGTGFVLQERRAA